MYSLNMIADRIGGANEKFGSGILLSDIII